MLARYSLKQGNGTPLVFLHGFLGDHRDWEGVASNLIFPCIAFDLPGHGASPFTEDFFTVFLKSVEDLPPFHLIGYSMGGRLAAQFARLHPGKIAKLTLLSAHLGLRSEEERKKRLEKDFEIAKKILEAPIDEFLKEWYDQPLFHTLIAKMDIRSMRRNQDKQGIAKALCAFSLGKQVIALRDAHLLVGEYDEAYRTHYQNLPHIVIPDAGHAIHLENPNAVARTLYDLSV
jgi:2-succinyl-6-hydroxy-2,4-cyclohexadiene-1-carboxylate synthase